MDRDCQLNCLLPHYSKHNRACVDRHFQLKCVVPHYIMHNRAGVDRHCPLNYAVPLYKNITKMVWKNRCNGEVGGGTLYHKVYLSRRVAHTMLGTVILLYRCTLFQPLYTCTHVQPFSLHSTATWRQDVNYSLPLNISDIWQQNC